MSSRFDSALVGDAMAFLVAESVGSRTRLVRGDVGAVELLGYGLDDLRALPVAHLFPTLGAGELGLLLRRERAARMTLPVRTASGAMVDAVVLTTPSRSGRMWTIQILPTTDEQERALRTTADAHERRFSTLTERSPIPTLLWPSSRTGTPRSPPPSSRWPGARGSAPSPRASRHRSRRPS